MKVYLLGPAAYYMQDAARLRTLVTLYKSAEIELTQKGYDVINICSNALPDPSEAKDHISTRIQKLLLCDAAFVLPDWHLDNVATIELVIAERAEMAIQFANNAIKVSRYSFDSLI